MKMIDFTLKKSTICAAPFGFLFYRDPGARLDVGRRVAVVTPRFFYPRQKNQRVSLQNVKLCTLMYKSVHN